MDKHTDIVNHPSHYELAKVKNKLGRIIGIKLLSGRRLCGRVVFENDELVILDQSSFYHSKLVRVLQSEIGKLEDEV